MPDIQGSIQADKSANGTQKIDLSRKNNDGPKVNQFTSDGTMPSDLALNNRREVGSGDQTSGQSSVFFENGWGEAAREGEEPTAGNDEDDDNDDSTDGSEDSSSDEEDIKAPVELVGEFLHYVRTSDWENAAKLCKMILIYEPNNATALEFQSVIPEKAQIEKELAEMSSSSDDDEGSSDEETEEEDEENETVNDEKQGDDGKEDDPDEFQPRPGSTMKNKLIFPHSEPVWKP